MVVVKVRETYDLATVKNKMTLIAIHTPKSDIIKKNYPGLLMQCKAYRPLSASVRVACASVQPLDPLGVGTSEGDVAPEDMFNPILYKAMTNVGLSQLEARIAALSVNPTYLQADVDGDTATVDVDTVTAFTDEFPVYYGLLSNAHGWKHAAPQQGLAMDNLKPLVFEMLYNLPDQASETTGDPVSPMTYPDADGNRANQIPHAIRGNAKPLPFINCTSYSYNKNPDTQQQTGLAAPGFPITGIYNSEVTVPSINCCVATLVIPPSKLHQLFYRMVVEWNIEFTGIRPLSEILNFADLRNLGNSTHYQNYSYSATKKALTGSDETILDNDACMVSANVNIEKVM